MDSAGAAEGTPGNNAAYYITVKQCLSSGHAACLVWLCGTVYSAATVFSSAVLWEGISNAAYSVCTCYVSFVRQAPFAQHQ